MTSFKLLLPNSLQLATVISLWLGRLTIIDGFKSEHKTFVVCLPRLKICSFVLDAVVVVGIVDVGDGADLSLTTFLGTKPRTLKSDHVGPKVFVEPRTEKN